jgi:putative phage-type endonuclease
MKIVDIIQGSPEWLAWRAGSDLKEGFAITATAAAAIAGTSQFMSAHRLWLEMTGRTQPKAITAFMLTGIKMEPRARELYELQKRELYPARCIQSEKFPWVRASLDGLSLLVDRALEVKCPGLKSHLEACKGKIIRGYYDQMQWQMLSSDKNIEVVDYTSYFKYDDERKDTEDLVVIPTLANPQRQLELLGMAEKFRKCLITDTPPDYVNNRIVGRYLRRYWLSTSNHSQSNLEMAFT